jgi:hypothetical protein
MMGGIIMEKVRLTKERTHYFAPSIHIVITADIIGIPPSII